MVTVEILREWRRGLEEAFRRRDLSIAEPVMLSIARAEEDAYREESRRDGCTCFGAPDHPGATIRNPDCLRHGDA